jgi:hypothetical protein
LLNYHRLLLAFCLGFTLASLLTAHLRLLLLLLLDATQLRCNPLIRLHPKLRVGGELLERTIESPQWRHSPWHEEWTGIPKRPLRKLHLWLHLLLELRWYLLLLLPILLIPTAPRPLPFGAPRPAMEISVTKLSVVGADSTPRHSTPEVSSAAATNTSL